MLWKLLPLAGFLIAWATSGLWQAFAVFGSMAVGTLVGNAIRMSLARRWKDSASPNKKAWAITQLAGAGDIGPAAKVLGEKGMVAIKVMVLLQDLKDSRITEGAIRMLDSDATLFREWALSYLGKFPEPHTIPFIAAKLEDPDPRVRETAAKVLAKLGNQHLAIVHDR